MRLLDTRTIQLRDFPPDQIPLYTILSHTWGDGEVSLQDVLDQCASKKHGYAKVVHSCAQALRDGYNYIWIDTCCIDKSSSAELSEAINSMFAWYNGARICYAYLADVSVPDNELPRVRAEGGADLVRGLWFTRGWTLQELLAPEKVRFYSAEWHFLGDRQSLAARISSITGIHIAFLQGLPLGAASIAQKMSWAAGRKTTREEDVAYSLLGIFDVHIPLLYGEGGPNAFSRLQEELLRKYDDQSLYAWHSKDIDPVPATLEWDTLQRSQGGRGWARAAITTGVLARSPDDFGECGDVVLCEFEGAAGHHSTMTNAGILIELPVCKLYGADVNASYALLKCRRRHDFVNALAIPIELDGDIWHRTSRGIQLVAQTSRPWRLARLKSMYLAPRPRRLNNYTPAHAFQDAFLISSIPDGWRIGDIHPSHATINSKMLHVLRSYPADHGREREIILVRLDHDSATASLLLVLVVQRPAERSLKKSLACHITEIPQGHALGDLSDRLELPSLGRAVQLIDGRRLGIKLARRNLFKSQFFVVDVEEISWLRASAIAASVWRVPTSQHCLQWWHFVLLASLAGLARILL